MVHLDEIPEKTFKEMNDGTVSAIMDMVNFMGEKGLCPVCFCHMLAIVAKNVAKVLEDREDFHAKTH